MKKLVALLLAVLLVAGAAAAQRKPVRKKPQPKPKPELNLDGIEDLFDKLPPAEEWSRIGSSKEVVVYINNRRITHAAGRPRAWFKYLTNWESAARVRKNDGTDVLFKLELSEFDCAQQKMRALSLAVYGDDEKVLNTFEPAEPAWGYVVPGTVGEAMLEAACNRAK